VPEETTSPEEHAPDTPPIDSDSQDITVEVVNDSEGPSSEGPPSENPLVIDEEDSSRESTFSSTYFAV
jgi:hypothetical protein